MWWKYSIIPVPKKAGIPYFGFVLSSVAVGATLGVISDVIGHWDAYFHPEVTQI